MFEYLIFLVIPNYCHHEYKVTKIIDNDLIQVYIGDQLNNKKLSYSFFLNWTERKTASTELI